VIAGERDNVYGSERQEITGDGVRDGHLIVYPGASHVSTLTNKRRVSTLTNKRLAEDVAAFLLAP
jgi:hypothetical protein